MLKQLFKVKKNSHFNRHGTFFVFTIFDQFTCFLFFKKQISKANKFSLDRI